MRRDLDEIIASQDRMPDARGEARGARDQRTRGRFEDHQRQAEHMRASRWRAASAAALVFILGACQSSPPPAAPLTSGALQGASVLLVTIDTLRRDRLGAYGGRPGLGRLSGQHVGPLRNRRPTVPGRGPRANYFT